MQISRRTKFSLSQLLSVVETQRIHVLLNKFGLNPEVASFPAEISEEVNSATEDILSNLLVEVVLTNKTLRNQTSPKYQFDDQYSI